MLLLNKQQDEINNDVEKIEKNIPNFLEVCFSRNKKNSGLKNDSTRSIWNTLKLVDEIIKTYKENYDSFFNHIFSHSVFEFI